MQHLHHTVPPRSAGSQQPRWERLEYTEQPARRGRAGEAPQVRDRRAARRIALVGSWVRSLVAG